MSSLSWGYCSGCHSKEAHVLSQQNYLRRNVYKCTGCGGQTLMCRVPGCDHFAKGALGREHLVGEEEVPFITWDDELCAEHDGRIGSFKRLSMRIEDLDNYPEIFVRDSLNVKRIGAYAGGALAGAGIVAGIVVTAGAAGPIAAALGSTGLLGAAGTGTAIASLSGAALTSASLAAIGGGMAAGTAVLTAAGAALGGIQGGVIANAYFAEDPSFAIRRINSCRTTQGTVYVNGFLMQDETGFRDWTDAHLDFEGSAKIHGVSWSSKSLKEIGRFVHSAVGSKLAADFLAEAALIGGKMAAKKALGPLALLSMAADIAKNPWHASMFRAGKTGVQLAEAISRTDGKSYTLVGHSLGCRVIFYALEALATKKDAPRIDNVILLGGAVGRTDDEGWRRAASAVNGRIFNCYSSRDHVLSTLYRTANLGLSDPIGLGPIAARSSKICNIDCSSHVGSHTAWKSDYGAVIRRLREI